MSRLKILVIDSSPLVAPRVKDLLSNHEESILIGEARDADEVLELFRFIYFDFVLLDLPFRDATTLLKVIKERFPSKVVMFTNNVEEKYREICLHLGADYFIDKSADFELLKEELLKELLIAA